jgi:hypothetical protein
MTLTTESALRKDKRGAGRTLNGTLQHRHFAVIAGILADQCEHMPQEQWSLMCNRFADQLAYTNARFDRHRFLMACSVNLLNGAA